MSAEMPGFGREDATPLGILPLGGVRGEAAPMRCQASRQRSALASSSSRVRRPVSFGARQRLGRTDHCSGGADLERWLSTGFVAVQGCVWAAR
jgi:hypothetical protein